MRVALFVVAVTLIAAAVVGCGAKSSDTSASSSGTSATNAASGATTSQFDNGPRAGETPIDESKVEAGEKLFQSKGCTACHAFGKKMSGPDLVGVTQRRTASWMENQILHPEKMVKEDPISRQLFAQYALQMANQGLTPEEAKSVIEYLKHRDHESAESK